MDGTPCFQLMHNKQGGGVFPYQDNIIAHSQQGTTWEGPCLLLERFRGDTIPSKRDKCAFLFDNFPRLGHLIDEHSFRPYPIYLLAFVHAPLPESRSVLRYP